MSTSVPTHSPSTRTPYLHPLPEFKPSLLSYHLTVELLFHALTIKHILPSYAVALSNYINNDTHCKILAEPDYNFIATAVITNSLGVLETCKGFAKQVACWATCWSMHA